MSEEFDPLWAGDRNLVPNKKFYSQAKDVEVLMPSTTCYLETVNTPQYCAKQFILRNLPSSNLKAISDAESVMQTSIGNNIWVANFKLYVRPATKKA